MVKLTSLSVLAVAVIATTPAFARPRARPEEAAQPQDLVTAEEVLVGGDLFSIAMSTLTRFVHNEAPSGHSESPSGETLTTGSGKGKGQSSTPEPPAPAAAAAPAPEAPTHQARELSVEQGLYERSVNEEIYERGLAFDADQFYARDPEYEELMSRGYYDDEELYSRELYDEPELYAREYYEGGEDLFSRGYYYDEYLD